MPTEMRRSKAFQAPARRFALSRLLARRRLPSAIYSPREFRALVDLESARADRYHSRFSLALFDVGASDENSVLIRRLVRTLHHRFRNTDELGWYSPRQIGVILPFTPAAGAWKLAEYVCGIVSAVTAPPPFTIFSYPSQNWPRKSWIERYLPPLSPRRLLAELLAAKAPGPDEFHALVARERSRSDRNGNIFSMLVFDLDFPGVTPLVRRSLLKELYRRLRDTDELGWYDPQHLAALLPYADAAQAAQIAENACRQAGLKTPKPFAVYTYPESWFPPARQDVPRSTLQPPPPAGAAADAGPPDAPRFAQTAPAGAPAAAAPEFFYPPLPRWKRALDVAGSLLALTLASPLLLLAAALIKLTSPGPVFFRQARVGYGRRPFTLYKLRTMQVNAATAQHAQYVRKLIVDDSESARMTKLEHLPQIIPGGRLLRALCVDELPQLWNVLRGDMSLVGPRPCLPYEADEYLRWHARRFDSVPGMTGLWQVSGKNRTTFKEMVRLDIQYERRRSLALDLKILALTPAAILRQLLERPAARAAAPDTAPDAAGRPVTR